MLNVLRIRYLSMSFSFLTSHKNVTRKYNVVEFEVANKMDANRRTLLLNVLLNELGEVHNDNVLLLIGQILNVDIDDDVYVNNYFEEVVTNYSDETYRTHFRMRRETMTSIITHIEAVMIENNVQVHNMAVSLEKKVHVTIWMLANYAVTFRECGTLFGMSTGCVHFIFLQICTALSLLRERVIQWPNEAQCEDIAEEILARTNFPGVIGAVDGCHIEIKAPSEVAYDYYNRKQFYSVVLQGTCEPSLKFTDIFVGMPGRMHDARVYRLSPLSQQIGAGMIPPNFHILADSAYSNHINVLTPFRDNGQLIRAQRRYNTKQASIRSMIERAFGLLKNKFRRLRFLDMSLLQEIPVVITACCVLHNLIIICEGYEEGEDEIDDIDHVEAEWYPHLEDAAVAGNLKRNQIINML